MTDFFNKLTFIYIAIFEFAECLLNSLIKIDFFWHFEFAGFLTEKFDSFWHLQFFWNFLISHFITISLNSLDDFWREMFFEFYFCKVDFWIFYFQILFFTENGAKIQNNVKLSFWSFWRFLTENLTRLLPFFGARIQIIDSVNLTNFA